MQTLFSPDSKIVQFLSRVTDLLLLNVLFLITSTPLLTIGASATAMYTVCFRFDSDKEGRILATYFRAFRDNFRQGTLLWLLVLLWGGTALVNTALFSALSGPLHSVFILFALLFVLAVLIGSCAFPLLSQFSNDLRSTCKNALVLSIGYLPRFILIALANLLPFLMLAVEPFLFFRIGFIWVALYFSAAAYLNSRLLKKVFAPYIPEEEV